MDEEKRTVQNEDVKTGADDPKPEKQLDDVIKAELQKQFNHGVRVGILSLSKLVNNKLSDSSLPLTKRIEEVRRLCKIDPEIEKKYNEIASKTE